MYPCMYRILYKARGAALILNLTFSANESQVKFILFERVDFCRSDQMMDCGHGNLFCVLGITLSILFKFFKLSSLQYFSSWGAGLSDIVLRSKVKITDSRG